MSLSPLQHISVLSSAARTASWSDEIIFSSDTVRIINGPCLPRCVIRIITVVTKAFESLLSWFLGTPIVLLHREKEQKDLTSTVTHLKELFGSRRVERSLEWCGINAQNLFDDGLRLSKQEITMLLDSFEVITTDDIEELLSELNSSQSSVRNLETETLEKLRHQFQGKTSINSCSSEEIQTLEKILLPFTCTEDQFINSPADRFIELSFPVTTFTMVENVTWALHLLRNKDYSPQDREAFIAKGLAQAPLPDRLLLPSPKGDSHYLYARIAGGGASKLLFRPLKQPEKVDPLVVYQGTRGPMPGDTLADSLSSLAEDLRTELGSSGAIATYELTKEFFENPSKGFIDFEAQGIRLVANSIGGAQAQRDAVLFHPIVKSITTNCSPGIDKATADLFREVMKQPRGKPMVITHNIDGEDIVDRVGDQHVGGNCPNVSLTFRSLSPADTGEKENQSTSWTPRISLFDFLFSFSLPSHIFDIFKAHARPTAAVPYKQMLITTDDPLTRDLANTYAQHKPPHFDPTWEQVRRYFCPVPSPGFAAFAKGKLLAESS